MKAPIWVLDETVVALHEQLIAAFGSSTGIRDHSLDSALARPENLLAYGTPTMFQLAASYAYGVVKNHPFIDGNKRTGFTVAVLFLELNRFRFTAIESEATIQTMALAAGDLGESAYAAWLEAWSTRK